MMSEQEFSTGQTEAATGFEEIKQVNPYGAEYWSARELMPLLGYDSWRRFADVIDRAQAACRNAGQETKDHFVGAVRMITIGKGGQREVDDFFLSRFGCYLVAMNGDPRKAEIAAAQAYFVVQTRRAEQRDQWDELREAQDERLRLRLRLMESNKRLAAAAQAAGVNSSSFGRFFGGGDDGLYGDMPGGEVKAHKGIPDNEQLDNRIGRAELIARDFVRSQTEQKLINENIHGADAATQAHYEVGRETRGVILRTGGTPPEDLPLNLRFYRCSTPNVENKHAARNL